MSKWNINLKNCWLGLDLLVYLAASFIMYTRLCTLYGTIWENRARNGNCKMGWNYDMKSSCKAHSLFYAVVSLVFWIDAVSLLQISMLKSELSYLLRRVISAGILTPVIFAMGSFVINKARGRLLKSHFLSN